MEAGGGGGGEAAQLARIASPVQNRQTFETVRRGPRPEILTLILTLSILGYGDSFDLVDGGQHATVAEVVRNTCLNPDVFLVPSSQTPFSLATKPLQQASSCLGNPPTKPPASPHTCLEACVR